MFGLFIWGMYSDFAAQTVILAFQHYIVMLGTTVMIATTLVPRMGGGPVSILVCIILLLWNWCIIKFLFCFIGSVIRVTKLGWFSHCYLCLDWILLFKHFLGQDFLRWWGRHLLMSSPCWVSSMISQIVTSPVSMMYAKYVL